MISSMLNSITEDKYESIRDIERELDFLGCEVIEVDRFCIAIAGENGTFYAPVKIDEETGLYEVGKFEYDERI